MKKAYVILGFEGSGSVFIAKTVSFVIGSCSFFGEWNGYGFNKELGENNIVLHRSIPFMRPKQWHDKPDEIKKIFKQYDQIKFIIATRDISASILSRVERFGGNLESYQKDNLRAKKLFAKIIKNEDFFIWNYETMLALENIYFRQLYKWLSIKSDFIPELKDGNKKYFKLNII